jgi:hypothetical protein
MPRKLEYHVWHEEQETPLHICGHKDEAIKWCRSNYHRSERPYLCVTWRNPYAKDVLEGGCLKLPSDFQE